MRSIIGRKSSENSLKFCGILQSIERRGGEDHDSLEKFLQSSFKSATDFRPQAKQTARLEPKFTEIVEDENKIQNSKRQGARSQSSSARLRYTPLLKSHSVTIP